MYIEKTVDGAMLDDLGFGLRKITVRLTCDDLGNSLGLSDDKRGIMIEIPLEAIADMVRVVKEGE